MRAHVLRVWEEIIGNLLSISECKDGAIVNVSGRNYLLPSFPKKFFSKLSMKGTIVGILRTENGYAVRIVKKTPSTRTFSAASTSPEEKHKEGSFETIRTVGPDLKQSSKQKESWENETKTSPLLLQTLYFLLFQRIVAFFGPMYLLHSHFVDFSVRSRLFQNCILEGGGMILNV